MAARRAERQFAFVRSRCRLSRTALQREAGTRPNVLYGRPAAMHWSRQRPLTWMVSVEFFYEPANWEFLSR